MSLDEDVSVIALTRPKELANYEGLENLCDLAFARRELKAGASIKIAAAGKSALAVAFHAHIDDWYVPLGPLDEVIYAVSTARSAMGRGVGGALACRAATEIAAKGGSAYLDCAMWNTRAQRAFQKIGFQRIGPETYLALANRASSGSDRA